MQTHCVVNLGQTCSVFMCVGVVINIVFSLSLYRIWTMWFRMEKSFSTILFLSFFALNFHIACIVGITSVCYFFYCERTRNMKCYGNEHFNGGIFFFFLYHKANIIFHLWLSLPLTMPSFLPTTMAEIVMAGWHNDDNINNTKHNRISTHFLMFKLLLLFLPYALFLPLSFSISPFAFE